MIGCKVSSFVFALSSYRVRFHLDSFFVKILCRLLANWIKAVIFSNVFISFFFFLRNLSFLNINPGPRFSSSLVIVITRLFRKFGEKLWTFWIAPGENFHSSTDLDALQVVLVNFHFSFFSVSAYSVSHLCCFLKITSDVLWLSPYSLFDSCDNFARCFHFSPHVTTFISSRQTGVW